jgi:putative DNA primase/helicase
MDGSWGEPPAEVANALREWRAGADLLRSFRLEKVVFDPAAHMMSRDVQKMFEEWLKARGHAVWSDQTFTDRWAAHPDVMAAGVTKKNGPQNSAGAAPPAAGRQ